MSSSEIYLAGGCLWGVQAYLRTLPGVTATEAGRANGTSRTLDGEYDGYAECVRTEFDPDAVTVGEKYRTGVYSEDPAHLDQARAFIAARNNADRIAVEVLPLTNFVRSADEHQDRLERCPDDYCHIPTELLTKYRT
jgi:peptide-methionine (S)-S-oxide reductase